MTTKATRKDEAPDEYERLERESIQEEHSAPESATEFPFGHNEPKGEPGEKKDARPRRTRGTGSLYRKPPCKLWVIQFYRNGRRVREATGTADLSEAKKLLRQRLHEVDQNTYLARRGRPARVADLYEALKAEREANRRGRKRELPGRWLHLGPAFGSMPAADVTTDDVVRYVRQRQREGAANATVNRELAALKRMFRLGAQATPPKVPRVPHIALLREDNARPGFVEDAGFARLALVAEAGEPWLRLFLELAYSYGWRRGELLGLRCGQVNLDAGTIRLDPGTTKNREGREVAVAEGSRLALLLAAALKGKGPDDHVLARARSKGPVRDFRGAWRSLCVRAGLGAWRCRACGAVVQGQKCGECGSRRRKYTGLIPHDLRRSAAKALRAAGVPESVVMAIGGWKTNTMFRRYAIVSSADQRAAVEMLELARARRAAQPALTPVLELQGTAGGRPN